ncbi:MAG: STAS domain-containing protein [Eubacterium sp.]|nr:STAS domain-containing protein [Eubacterium sp.]
MNIAKNRNRSTLEILLEGRLDTVTSPDLDVVIKDSLDGVTELIFDLDKLEYISSSGLRTLLAAQKIMNKQGTMKIVDANEMVMEIFEVTGFIDILNVETRA